MVLDGRVRERDTVENNAADEAADFGRFCFRWYPVLLSLHRFLLPFLGLW